LFLPVERAEDPTLMKNKRKLIWLFAAPWLLAGCAPSPTFLNPNSSIASRESSLYNIILYLGLVVLAIVEIGFLWTILRDRKRKDDDSLPPQIVGSKRVEFIWTLMPVLLVLTLFILTVQTMNAVAAPRQAASDLNLLVVGHRWWWEFDYPDLGIVSANELHVPAGTNVQITLQSVDVIHSFWIPQLSGKTDVVPGQTNTMWFNAGQPGTYLGQCAEFCGTEHALMRIKVVVDSPEDFKAWVANQQKPAVAPTTPDEQAGQKIINGTCASCHSLNPNETQAKVGPNLAHLYSRSVFAGATFDLTENNLRLWLKDTQAMKPGNDMQITLLPKEIDQVMAYLKLLK
jgi:cytochrome c oxidase subunit 2